MKKSRYTEEQIIGILKQHEVGVKTVDLCRSTGLSASRQIDPTLLKSSQNPCAQRLCIVLSQPRNRSCCSLTRSPQTSFRNSYKNRDSGKNKGLAASGQPFISKLMFWIGAEEGT